MWPRCGASTTVCRTCRHMCTHVHHDTTGMHGMPPFSHTSEVSGTLSIFAALYYKSGIYLSVAASSIWEDAAALIEVQK